MEVEKGGDEKEVKAPLAKEEVKEVGDGIEIEAKEKPIEEKSEALSLDRILIAVRAMHHELKDALNGGILTFRTVKELLSEKLGVEQSEIKRYKTEIVGLMLQLSEENETCVKPKKKDNNKKRALPKKQEKKKKAPRPLTEVERKLASMDPEWRQRFGEIVWAKQAGFPHWPALIFDPHDVQTNIQKQAVNKIGKQHLLVFFATSANEQFGWCSLKDLIEWQTGLDMKMHEKAKAFKQKKYANQFPLAVQEASKWLERPQSERHLFLFPDGKLLPPHRMVTNIEPPEEAAAPDEDITNEDMHLDHKHRDDQEKEKEEEDQDIAEDEASAEEDEENEDYDETNAAEKDDDYDAMDEDFETNKVTQQKKKPLTTEKKPKVAPSSSSKSSSGTKRKKKSDIDDAAAGTQAPKKPKKISATTSSTTPKKQAEEEQKFAEEARRKRLEAAKATGVPIWKIMSNDDKEIKPSISILIIDLEDALVSNDDAKARSTIDRLDARVSDYIQDLEILRKLAHILKTASKQSEPNLAQSAKMFRIKLRKLHESRQNDTAPSTEQALSTTTNTTIQKKSAPDSLPPKTAPSSAPPPTTNATPASVPVVKQQAPIPKIISGPKVFRRPESAKPASDDPLADALGFG